jgi:uncharacterized membrane protein YhhN
MVYFWLVVAFILAVIDWIAVTKQANKLEYIAKPGVMLALLIFVVASGGLAGAMIWFALGLVFSMAGDIFLMLPKEKFVAGLVAFLLAHIAYLAGFNSPPSPLGLPALVTAAVIMVTSILLYRRIAAGLEASRQTKLRLPVLAYTMVISLMLFSALLTLTNPAWRVTAALLVSAGALMFFLSDAVLAWNKFVTPIPHGRLINLSLYHLGQIGITWGAALMFIPS